MNKKTGFIASLNKSTKITLFSCVSFVVLTCIILVFFVMFPITPSEKIMASIGRENVFNGGDSSDPARSAVPEVVTTSPDDAAATSIAASSTKAVSTTTRTVKIVITTGSGFLWNGRIPTGVVPGESYPTTPVMDDPIVPTHDPGYTPGVNTDPPVVDPNPPVVDPVDPPVVDPVDPPVVDPVDPPVVDPNPPVVDPNPPVIDPNPPVDPGVDPPAQNPGDVSEPSPDPNE